MEDNGGFSTLKNLNESVLKIPNVKWKTKTPFASIRRIVQDSRFFFKIKPGLWALKSYKEKLPLTVTALIEESKAPEKEQKYTHSYYQGILAEIGIHHNYSVYIPPQDKNKPFLNKQLKDVRTLEELPRFTYEHILNRIKSIDVIWINERRFPESVFEVEHSTDFTNSLNKFHELIDFYVDMVIVSDTHRLKEFDWRIDSTVYQRLKSRTRFYDYDYLENYYSNPFQSKKFIE